MKFPFTSKTFEKMLVKPITRYNYAVGLCCVNSSHTQHKSLEPTMQMNQSLLTLHQTDEE